MVLLFIRFQFMLMQAHPDKLYDLRRHDAVSSIVIRTDARIGLSFTILGHCVARNPQAPGYLPLADTIDQIHIPNSFIIFHRDDHLTDIPSIRLI